jgi:carbon storage regulator
MSQPKNKKLNGCGNLMLSRDEGQSISIGNNVRVTVVVARSGKARIAVEAPKDIAIIRTELLAGTQ